MVPILIDWKNNWRYDKTYYWKCIDRIEIFIPWWPSANFRIESCSYICQLIPFKTTHEALQTQAPDLSNECNEVTALHASYLP